MSSVELDEEAQFAINAARAHLIERAREKMGEAGTEGVDVEGVVQIFSEMRDIDLMYVLALCGELYLEMLCKSGMMFRVPAERFKGTVKRKKRR
jgi:hypothetical protein